jgi:hypothetical protein
MASPTEICNLALGHLGIGKEIATLEEKSDEAAACRRYYPLAVEAVLGDFAWPFATRFATLALVESDPTEEWAYSYRYPSDCLMVRRILSGTRQDSLGSREEYRIASDSQGMIILTDKEDATIEYTVELTDTAMFGADFIEALSFRIAMAIAPRVTGGDPFGLGNRAAKMYEAAIQGAKAGAANEEAPPPPLEAESIRARD